VLAQAVASVAGPALGALLVGMALRRKLDALNREIDALARPARGAPILRRPSYRPRWRFPFRALRAASLWTLLVVTSARGLHRCIPEPRPIPAVIDCAHDQSFVCLACALAEVVLLQATERARR